MRTRIILALMAALSTSACLAQQTALLEAPAAKTASSFVAFGGGTAPGDWATGASIMPVLPKKPQREASPKLNTGDWMLLGAAGALRFFDYKSTVKGVANPTEFREVELPEALVHNRPGLGAFEASTVVANYYVYRALVRHHRRSLARVGQSINLSALGWTVGNNYRLLSEH